MAFFSGPDLRGDMSLAHNQAIAKGVMAAATPRMANVTKNEYEL